MHGHRTASSLTLALLTATFLTPPERALAAPGDALGREFQVNSFTASHQRASSIAMDADGDFIVAWHSTGQDGNSWGVFARRYNAAGRPEGGVFQVNQETASHQTYPSVAVDADGDFVVAWGSNGQDGSGYGIYARRYDAAGVAQGPEFQVNTFVTGSQSRPAVAMDAEGDFVVAWQSNGQDGSSYGVFAQRYDGVARVAGDFDGDGNADILWHNAATGTAVVWLMDGTEKLAVQSIGGAPVVWQVARIGEFNGDGKADILWHNAVTGAALVWQMDGFARTAAVGVGGAPTAWVIEKVEDTDGDGLSDIFWRNSATGATVVWLIRGFARVEVGGTGSVPADWQTH